MFVFLEQDTLIQEAPARKPEKPETAIEKKEARISNCKGDRAPFCKRANSRTCAHPAYEKACCESCDKLKGGNDKPKTRRKRFRRRRRRRHH